jgi:Uncharacterised protein family (UPF0172)
VGYYQASERLDDTSLVPVGEKVAGKIKAGFNDAIAFVVRHANPLFVESHHLHATQIDGEKLGTEIGLIVRGASSSRSFRRIYENLI